ncbi:hypothetical protein CCP1ISM_190008 [Azospirillaceae bacterium]
MNVLNEIIFNAKDRLSCLGIRYSDNRFSTDLLLKSPRYVSWLRSTDHAPAAQAMVSLYSKLNDLAFQYEEAGATATAKQIVDIAEPVWWGLCRASLGMPPQPQHPPNAGNSPGSAAGRRA